MTLSPPTTVRELAQQVLLLDGGTLLVVAPDGLELSGLVVKVQQWCAAVLPSTNLRVRLTGLATVTSRQTRGQVVVITPRQVATRGRGLSPRWLLVDPHTLDRQPGLAQELAPLVCAGGEALEADLFATDLGDAPVSPARFVGGEG